MVWASGYVGRQLPRGMSRPDKTAIYSPAGTSGGNGSRCSGSDFGSLRSIGHYVIGWQPNDGGPKTSHDQCGNGRCAISSASHGSSPSIRSTVAALRCGKSRMASCGRSTLFVAAAIDITTVPRTDT